MFLLINENIWFHLFNVVFSISKLYLSSEGEISIFIYPSDIGFTNENTKTKGKKMILTF